jgi:predicted nuclease with TOPRIM domain
MLLEKQIDEFNEWQRNLISKMEALVKQGFTSREKKPIKDVKPDPTEQNEMEDKLVKLKDEIYFLKQRVECLEDKMSSMNEKMVKIEAEYDFVNVSEIEN